MGHTCACRTRVRLQSTPSRIKRDRGTGMRVPVPIEPIVEPCSPPSARGLRVHDLRPLGLVLWLPGDSLVTPQALTALDVSRNDLSVVGEVLDEDTPYFPAPYLASLSLAGNKIVSFRGDPFVSAPSSSRGCIRALV